jgi:hypothetical protein
MSILSIWEITENYKDKEYQNKTKYPESANFRFIEDEEKSIRWNREQKELMKEKYEEAVEAYEDENNRLIRKLADDMAEAIEGEFKLINKEQAIIIYNKAYEEKHSSMQNVFIYAEELAELYESLRKLETT